MTEHVHHLSRCPAWMGKDCFGCEWKRYAGSMGIALFVATVQLFVALLIKSMSAEADAIHLYGDSLLSGFSLGTALLVHHHSEKEELLREFGAYFQAAGFLVATWVIATEALAHTQYPESALAIIILGAVGVAGSGLRMAMVHPESHLWKMLKSVLAVLLTGKRLNSTQILEITHIALDFLTSISVIVAGVGFLFGSAGIDKIVALWFIAPCTFVSAILALLLARGHHHH